MKVALVLMLLACSCAADPVSTNSQAIIGGTAATEADFPATGALMVSLLPSCTGTLISPSVVLTAAHCVDPELVGADVPWFTLNPNGLGAPLGEIIKGKETRMHPDFDPTREPVPGVTEWFDIALLILSEPIYDVEYGVIPTPSEAARALVADAPVNIVGYGQSDVDDQFQFGLKKYASTELVEVGDFEIWTSRAGEPQKCFGDSGGPAYMEMAGGLRIAGIASRLPGTESTCINGAIETRTDPYGPWVAANAPELCEELDCDETGLPVPPSDGGCNAGGSGGSAHFLWLMLGLAWTRRRLRA